MKARWIFQQIESGTYSHSTLYIGLPQEKTIEIRPAKRQKHSAIWCRPAHVKGSASQCYIKGGKMHKQNENHYSLSYFKSHISFNNSQIIYTLFVPVQLALKNNNQTFGRTSERQKCVATLSQQNNLTQDKPNQWWGCMSDSNSSVAILLGICEQILFIDLIPLVWK